MHDTWKAGGFRKISPFFIIQIAPNLLAGQVSLLLDFRGPNMSIASACATSGHALGEAAAAIARGDADVMIAGGAESTVTPLAIGAFAQMRALSTRNDAPAEASRPYDRDRDGFVMGEGAGVVVLETYEHAKSRGARIYAEVVGYGLSGDAHHITAPAEDGDGALRCMNAAIKRAGIAAAEIDYINAHGTSTPLGDLSEVKAIKQVFGEHAYKLMVSSTKSMSGHLLGAAGAFEAIACLLALRDGCIPPTINYTTPDPALDLDYVPNTARAKTIKTALSNSMGFGGHNASLIFVKA